TVTYYSESGSYIIYETATNVSVTVAIGDTKQWTLYNGETLTQQVLDFNHDYSDTAETSKLGITYAMKNCLTTTRQMNPSYKHAFNFKFGNETAIVSDSNDHSSTTDAALTNSHTATADEVTAGFVDITALGPTYITKIMVKHSDNSTVTWYFGKEGFYAGSDVASVSGCSWYKSDLDESEVFYKIGKMLQSLNLDVVNWQGSVGLNGWGTVEQEWCYYINKNETFSTFGGLKINATGTDTLNTAAKNPVNGTGKSRLTFCKDKANDWNNFTEISEGTVISVPVVTGDVVTVVAYGVSRNWGGWDNSAMKKWANGDFLAQLPLGLRSTIVAAYKKSSVGNRSYAIQGGTYLMWCLSNSEIGGYVSNHPYMDEGSKYPIFTDNNSRIKKLADGAGAATTWWERSPIIHFANYFMYCISSGGPYGSSGANNAYGVCLGFCSGEASA
ncbi:MAG: hypothetical protein IKN04_10640, partial [Clostridia bacterium]|nr:hypothetical protein [Clostridia bacterium]